MMEVGDENTWFTECLLNNIDGFFLCVIIIEIANDAICTIHRVCAVFTNIALL